MVPTVPDFARSSVLPTPGKICRPIFLKSSAAGKKILPLLTKNSYHCFYCTEITVNLKNWTTKIGTLPYWYYMIKATN
jgi:hypothetical protein